MKCVWKYTELNKTNFQLSIAVKSSDPSQYFTKNDNNGIRKILIHKDKRTGEKGGST